MRYVAQSFLVLTGLAVFAGGLILLPAGPAGAWQAATPTQGLLSDTIFPGASPTAAAGDGGGLLIPTSTPVEGGGLLIPTSTPVSGGGLIIPTSTPAPSEPSFPPLSDADLTAILLQPGDVPADFAANQQIETFTAEGLIASLNDSGMPDLASSFQEIADTYGWGNSIAITYSSCQPTVPISQIYSEVLQLAGSAAGRAFFDDPQVEDFFTALGYVISPAENVHGWRTVIGPKVGTCSAQETEYGLMFEYWGLFVFVSMVADANTDPGLVNGLLDQLAAQVMAHADALATTPFPPTPVPGSVVLEPTPTAIAVEPTPTIVVAAPTPTPEGTRAWLQDIELVMPTMSDLGMESPPWQLDTTLSAIYTLDQLVALFQSGGLTEIADATRQAGQRSGLIGQVTRLWSTGITCGDPALLEVEISVALFNDTGGPLAQMNDPGIRQAWLNTGIYGSITPRGAGQLWEGTTDFHRCGRVQFRNWIVPHERFLILVALTASASADPNEVVTIADNIATFTIEKLEGAGLQ